jgi:hypothetical protein
MMKTKIDVMDAEELKPEVRQFLNTDGTETFATIYIRGSDLCMELYFDGVKQIQSFIIQLQDALDAELHSAIAKGQR